MVITFSWNIEREVYKDIAKQSYLLKHENMLQMTC